MKIIVTKLLSLKDKELLIQTFISFNVRVLAAISGFVLSFVVSHQLGVEDAGYFFLAFSIVTVLSAVSRFGLDNTLVRFIGEAVPDNEWGVVRAVLYRSVIIALSISIPVSLLVYYFSDFLAKDVFDKPYLTEVLRDISPGIVGLSLFTLLAMSLQGLRKVISSVMTLNVLVNFLLICALLFWGVKTPEDAAWAYSLASISTAIIGYFLFAKSLKTGSGNIKWRALLQSCMPLWVVVIMAQLTQYSGQFIAGAWVPAEEVAQLAVAQRTALLTSFILMAVNLVVAPRFASMYKKKEFKKLEKLALTSVKLMVVFALPIVTILLVFPELVMSLFGDGFSEGALFLQILAVGQFINVATGSVGFLLTMSGHEKDLRNTVLISGPAAIGLAFLLVPWYGAVGSAAATAIAIATQNLIAVYWVKKRLGFNTLAVWR